MEKLMAFNPLYGNPQTPEHLIVSVCVTTYNHGKYIRQCLDSILMQKTSFPFEVIIGEDDSPDDTREIVKEYADLYPDKIRLFLRRREDVIYVNDKPTGRFNFLSNLKAAKGKYIAFCEGDDYWTDPLKLQKQVDFLEDHKEYVICGHDVHVDAGGNLKKTAYPNRKEHGKDLFINNFIPTLSLLFRQDAMPNPFPKVIYETQMGDLTLCYLLSLSGKIKILPQVMGGRRIHPQGNWSQVNKIAQYNHYLDAITKLKAYMPEEQEKYYNAGVNKILIQRAIIEKTNNIDYKKTLSGVNFENAVNKIPYSIFFAITKYVNHPRILDFVRKVLNKI